MVVVLIAAIIIPIIIVYTAAEQDNGNRIASIPLMEKDNDEKLAFFFRVDVLFL